MSPARSRCCSRNDVEKVTLKGVELVGHDLGGIALGDHRARVARRGAPARRTHRAAEGADPQLPRRGEDLDHPDRDSRQRRRPADGDGHRRPAAEPDRTARAAAQRPADERRADDQGAQPVAPQQPRLRPAAHRHARAPSSTARRSPRCRPRCSPCSKAIAAAAASRRSAAPRSASGSSRWTRRSAARAC